MESAMSSTDLRDLNHGGSFSFSCSESTDLNFPSLSHFTDDDDDDGDDDESYIEIAFDHHSKPTHDGEDHEGDIHYGTDYLRISFSSSLLPNYIQDDNINIVASDENTTDAVNQTTSSSASSTRSRSGPVEWSGVDSSSVHRRKRGRLPAVNRLVNTLLFSLWSPPSETATKYGAQDDSSIGHHQLPVPIHVDNGDLVPSRKASNMRSSINGGIMKMLFKFRAMNLGTLVASLVKPRQVASPNHKDHMNNGRKTNKKKSKESTIEYNQKPVKKPLDKWLVQKKQRNKCGIKNCSSSSESVVGGEKSRVLEINLSAVRGVLEAIGSSMSTGVVGRKERRTMSCPSSIKSSPLHKEFTGCESKVYARETSIQAAIAHCKISCEQTS